MLSYLRSFNFITVILRLSLAVLSGGAISLGRTRKGRAAGLRTYMLISTGASLTVLLSQYEYQMMQTDWAGVVSSVGSKLDVSRYAAQVVTGIGFLAAGTILSSPHGLVSGLTTATGLITAGCLGIAAGAGFYECLIVAIPAVIFAMDGLLPVEQAYKRRIRNITICIEFYSLENVNAIAKLIEGYHAHIFDLEYEKINTSLSKASSIIVTLKLDKGHASHSEILSAIAEQPYVVSVQELIS